MAPPLHLLRLAIFDSGDNKERLLCLSRGSARWSPAFRNEPGNSVREGMLTQRLFDDAGKSFPCRQFDQTGRSEEHTSELQSLMRISYAVFCLKEKKNQTLSPA